MHRTRTAKQVHGIQHALLRKWANGAASSGLMSSVFFSCDFREAAEQAAAAEAERQRRTEEEKRLKEEEERKAAEELRRAEEHKKVDWPFQQHMPTWPPGH